MANVLFGQLYLLTKGINNKLIVCHLEIGLLLWGYSSATAAAAAAGA